MPGKRSYARSAGVGDYSYFHIGAAQAVSTQINKTNQGAFLGHVICNTPGTTTVLTLTDGSGGPTIAQISPSAGQTYFFDIAVNSGIFYTCSGSGMSLTVTYLDQTPTV